MAKKILGFLGLGLLAGCMAIPTLRTAPPAPFGAVPSPRQLAWHEMEMYNMIEFSTIQYLDDVGWGWGNESPSLVNPVDFDAETVVKEAKAAGFKGFLVQAKHHGGFCMWPTKTTPYNITASPFRNGKGDWVGEWQAACKKQGLKFGVYCSPWDRSTDKFGTPEYLAMYKEQLRELMTHYGELFTIWFDGAPGDGGDGYYGGKNERRNFSGGKYYPWPELYAFVRELQPNAVIFHDPGPDLRWVGNEQGYAPETSWSTFGDPVEKWDGLPAPAKSFNRGGGQRFGTHWVPAECDASLRRSFTYHASDNLTVKTPAKLFDMYINSVGRGHCLDLNLPINRQGTMDDSDRKSLREFGELLKQAFAKDLAKGAKLTVSNVRGNDNKQFGPKHLLDDDRYSYWATDDQVTAPECVIELARESTFNIIRLRENIKLGQRLDSAAIDIWVDGAWKEIAHATSIGACRLIRLPAYVTAKKLRLRLQAPVCIALSEFGLFAEPQCVEAPAITRSKAGLVTLATRRPAYQIRYTTDGSEPSLSATLYTQPFPCITQASIRAAAFDATGKRGELSAKDVDMCKGAWTVMGCSTESTSEPAKNAIDENEATRWDTGNMKTPRHPPPQWLAIDMGKEETIAAFTYLPRQDSSACVVDRYEYHVSTDGKTWTKVAAGEFDNIRNSPTHRIVNLKQPVTCRYFKFIGIRVLEGTTVTAAEIGARK